MERRVIHDSDFKNGTVIFNGKSSFVIRLRDGSILKVIDPIKLQDLKATRVDIERKVLDAKPILNSPEILVPTAAVYSRNCNFMGYTMREARGVDYNAYNSRLTVHQRCDLYMYARNHSRIESVLRKNPDIVFPDIYNFSNIFIDDSGNVSFIDYDGLQVGRYSNSAFSVGLGDPKDYFYRPKYYGNGYFTKELDKKSSIFLYFYSTFGLNLSKVGEVNPATGRVITLDDCFQYINLDDPELCHKVWKTFQDNQPNEFLGDTVHYVADKYNMRVVDKIGSNYWKILTKRR